MIGLESRALESARLRYTLLDDSDKPALRALLNSPEVTEPAGFRPARTDAEFDEFFNTLTRYRTGLGIRFGDALAGYIHVNPWRSDIPPYSEARCASFGFVVGTPWQGRGFATEALQTLTDYMKRRVDYCFADHFEGNAPSRRVILKAGYRYVETYSMFFDTLGREETCLSYVR